MTGKLLINGTAFSVNISDQDWRKFLKSQGKKQTGYERVPQGDRCFYCGALKVDMMTDTSDSIDDELYDAANYYSSEEVAENNLRADKLMRKLRRFAVEHRRSDLVWNAGRILYHICYNYQASSLDVISVTRCQTQGAICFDAEETARLAIEEFHDELIWLFTKYRDSL